METTAILFYINVALWNYILFIEYIFLTHSSMQPDISPDIILGGLTSSQIWSLWITLNIYFPCSNHKSPDFLTSFFSLNNDFSLPNISGFHWDYHILLKIITTYAYIRWLLRGDIYVTNQSFLKLYKVAKYDVMNRRDVCPCAPLSV